MKIAALVLAAGASRRFGDRDKLLADAGGKPVLARVLAALCTPAIGDIVVVVRPGAEAVRSCMASAGLARPVRFAVSAEAEAGLSRSIAAGLTALPAAADGVLITPGDMPGLSHRTVERLAAAFAARDGMAIAFAALADGSQRNPVVWPRRLWPRLAELTGDRGGKLLIAEDGATTPPAVVAVADAGELADIDTADDLARYNVGHHRRDPRPRR